MKKDNNEIKDEDSFWEEGSFVETISKEEAKRIMKSINMKEDEDVNYNCRLCNKLIGLHNKDWHDGMCNECFNKTYFNKE